MNKTMCCHAQWPSLHSRLFKSYYDAFPLLRVHSVLPRLDLGISRTRDETQNPRECPTCAGGQGQPPAFDPFNSPFRVTHRWQFRLFFSLSCSVCLPIRIATTGHRLLALALPWHDKTVRSHKPQWRVTAILVLSTGSIQCIQLACFIFCPDQPRGLSFWLLTTRSRVRFPALPWEFFRVGGGSQWWPWSG